MWEAIFSPEFKGERIPALREVLEACKGRMKLNIELKNIGNDTSLPEQVAALVKEYDMEDQCVITSVKLKYLERVKDMNPDLRTGYILAAAYGNYYESSGFRGLFPVKYLPGPGRIISNDIIHSQ